MQFRDLAKKLQNFSRFSGNNYSFMAFTHLMLFDLFAVCKLFQRF